MDIKIKCSDNYLLNRIRENFEELRGLTGRTNAELLDICLKEHYEKIKGMMVCHK